MILATILTVHGALVAGFFANGTRWPKGSAPAASRLKMLKGVLVAGLAVALAFAVAALGWVAGTALWIVAIMGAGVAVVSLASARVVLAQRLGLAVGVAGLFLGAIPMAYT